MDEEIVFYAHRSIEGGKFSPNGNDDLYWGTITGKPFWNSSLGIWFIPIVIEFQEHWAVKEDWAGWLPFPRVCYYDSTKLSFKDKSEQGPPT